MIEACASLPAPLGMAGHTTRSELQLGYHWFFVGRVCFGPECTTKERRPALHTPFSTHLSHGDIRFVPIIQCMQVTCPDSYYTAHKLVAMWQQGGDAQQQASSWAAVALENPGTDTRPAATGRRGLGFSPQQHKTAESWNLCCYNGAAAAKATCNHIKHDTESDEAGCTHMPSDWHSTHWKRLG